MIGIASTQSFRTNCGIALEAVSLPQLLRFLSPTLAWSCREHLALPTAGGRIHRVPEVRADQTAACYALPFGPDPAWNGETISQPHRGGRLWVPSLLFWPAILLPILKIERLGMSSQSSVLGGDPRPTSSWGLVRWERRSYFSDHLPTRQDHVAFRAFPFWSYWASGTKRSRCG
jgi:hypothetical protein